jgi:hypothetical protein
MDVGSIYKLEREWREKQLHFHNRTNKHIHRVQSNILDLFTPSIDAGEHLISIVDSYQLEKETLLKESREHDRTKFEDPQYRAYIEISWSYYQKLDLNKPYPLNQVMQSNATIHHIISEKHHPEYWDPDFLVGNKFNVTNRDGIPDTPVDATNMPLTWVAVMTCDWVSIGQERGTRAGDWANQMIDKRWLFAKDQKQLIWHIITYFGMLPNV